VKGAEGDRHQPWPASDLGEAQARRFGGSPAQGEDRGSPEGHKGEHRFVTVRVDDPTLIQELEAAKVRFAGQIENT
jgi:hypothetical protein